MIPRTLRSDGWATAVIVGTFLAAFVMAIRVGLGSW